MVLDLTPNYGGTTGPWFANISVTNVAERLKVGLYNTKPTVLETEVKVTGEIIGN